MMRLKSKGTLITCTVTEDKLHKRVAQHQLLCVGKPKGTTYFRCWEHTPSLAPSRELVTYTKRRSHSDISWFKFYTESLIDEWSSDSKFKNELTRVLKWLSEGEDVAVACYCHPMKRSVCHLKILGDIVIEFGYNVIEYEEE